MLKKLSYKTSGVDIDQANLFVSGIQKFVKRTQNPHVLHRRGAFGGLYELAKKSFRQPVLVSSTDGVGTKLLIANAVKKHDTVGVDLVAMNVNDILCSGALPLFFLDYIACGRLDSEILNNVVKGIALGCREAGCALIGGETAEMPDMYRGKDYDLAGFAVGIVEKNKIIDGSTIKDGDWVIGLPSSGIHSNGYSLVRKVYTLSEQKVMANELLKPTRIYVKEMTRILESYKVNGIAHITGGAYYDKLTKILPRGKSFTIDKSSWPVPKIFQNIQKKGKINDSEMYRTFNMGIGMVLVASEKEAQKILSLFSSSRTRAYHIGVVTRNSQRKIFFC